MPRLRHVIEVPGYYLPGHLTRTLCGRTVAFGRMPNVPRTDPRYCARCQTRADAEAPR